MPFVRIDALHAGQAKLNALGRAVHEALIDAIGIPANDLFQVLTSHDGATGAFRYDPDYLGVHRDDGLVFVDITMRSGRTSKQKQALYRRIAELASKHAGTCGVGLKLWGNCGDLGLSLRSSVLKGAFPLSFRGSCGE
jgi:hypothetical protein